MSDVTVEGIKQTIRRLGKLPGRLDRKVMRQATGAGGREVVKEARKRVRRRFGQLRRALGQRVKRLPDGTFIAVVGVRKGFVIMVDGKRINPEKYIHLVELGTTHSAAQPFLRTSLPAAQAAAVRKFAEKAGAGIEREVARLAKE